MGSGNSGGAKYVRLTKRDLAKRDLLRLIKLDAMALLTMALLTMALLTILLPPLPLLKLDERFAVPDLPAKWDPFREVIDDGIREVIEDEIRGWDPRR